VSEGWEKEGAMKRNKKRKTRTNSFNFIIGPPVI
jgi:hypothetical protein